MSRIHFSTFPVVLIHYLGFCHTAMEILGIFWAASILHSSSVMAIASDVIGRESQQHPSVATEGTAAWLNSLMPAYRRIVSASDVNTIYRSYVTSASWLLPNLSRAESLDESVSSEDQFVTLVPAISAGLTSLKGSSESALELPPEESEEAEPDLIDERWDSWTAVAAVRTETAVEPLPQDWQVEFDNACFQEGAVPYQSVPLALKAAPKTQVWVHNRFIGDVSGQVSANKIATKLRNLLQEGKLEPSQIRPIIGSNFAGAGYGGEMLFVVDETMRSHPEVPATEIAVQWVNNLRLAFNEAPLGLTDVQMAISGLAETSKVLYGTASWYGPGFHGRKTANGEIFDENTLTAAHKTLPFNTHLKVTNRLNGKSVIVRINDRGPYVGQRSLDLSKAAAYCLGSTHNGVIPYEAVILETVEKPDLNQVIAANPVE
ncbi:septal ring lytic transglycosylase RlpA family protein [Oscillatoria sp. CS-180]|uniref:septal ring lytic transglycosylase RlpA family protein n=1 Tax=Oscillatoria sp. CS-180 TaxID=3021720 RepID=UPI002330EDA4|nr:septal ring lytic transglycosylase RlpA family protein [Oscillatoria sp. CS-180]MDB9524619.1 septal ring lytic transglycosylase RlpA family protein [Oscillatoria sp. CS-180]